MGKSVNRQSGQILLIVILAMVVALTVGLSIMSHTVTNLKTAKQNEESQRAFQAAQAGLDQALKQFNIANGGTINTPPATTLENQAEFAVNINSTNASSSTFTEVNNGDMVNQDQGFDVWLAAYPNLTDSPFTGKIQLYWDENSSTTCSTRSISADSNPIINPALEVLILSNPSAPTLTKYVYDPCSGRTTNAIDPTAISPGSKTVTDNSKTYEFRSPDASSAQVISISNGMLMKIVPLYNSTTVAMKVLSGTNLPSQGKVIDSTGTYADTVRKLQYFISYPQMPAEFMQYAIISQ